MDQEMWRAVVDCDASYDGTFFYGLVTTGIFCRPSCRSRTPKPENVRFFRHAEEALQQGFRPCKRCRPESLGWRGSEQELADKVRQLLDQHDGEALGLQELADRLYVSPFHLQRCFKRVTGETPAQYLLRKRVEAAQTMLLESELSVTEIARRNGFSSLSHFSAVFQKFMKCPPGAYRKRAAKEPG